MRETLRRLAIDGSVRRLSKGYYDIPRVSERIGDLGPTPEAIIAAHARKTGATIERPEIDAANRLGLTTQVVARPTYRTNLFSRDLKIGGQTIRLRTASPRSLARDGNLAELIIDALRGIGRARISKRDLAKVRDLVRKHKIAKDLRQRARRAPSWMVPIIDNILSKASEANG